MATKNTPIAKDWFVLGLITGSLSAAGKTLVDKAMKTVGLPSINYDSLARGVLRGGKQSTKTTTDTIMNVVSDSIIGGIVGTGLHGLYAFTPPGNEVVKGALGGSIIWAGSMFIGSKLKVFNRNFTSKEMASMLVTNIVFGALQGAVIGKYSAKTIVQSHPILVKEVDDRSFDDSRLAYTDSRQPPNQPSNGGGNQNRLLHSHE